MALKAKILNRLKGWRFSGTPEQGEPMPHWPCNFWHQCREQAGTVELWDPHYGDRREFRVYSGEVDGVLHTFAYEEVSNGVFAVFERT